MRNIAGLLKTLTKAEIIERAEWRCPTKGHAHHSGLEHPSCYSKLALNQKEHIGFIDIETEDLRADYGISFCYCIKDSLSDKIYKDCLTLQDIKNSSSHNRNEMPKEDKRIIRSCVRDMENFTRLVTHYGSRFDFQFLRTRAVICGVDFPSYGAYCQTDNWDILKSKFKLSRNSQENASVKLRGETRKDHLSLSIKHGCLRGEKWALDLTLKHCIGDVLDCEDNYNLINKFARKTKRSI